MKHSIYALGIGLISIVMTSSCEDHRIPVTTQSCQIVQETTKINTTNNVSTSPNDETITIDGSTYGLPATQTFNLTFNEAHTYTYNSQKLLIQESILYTSSNSSTNYDYNSSVIKQSEFTGGSLTKVTSYSLNAQNLIGSIINGNITYKYDANGYLIETTEILNPAGIQKTTYTIDNGNVVKMEITNPNFKLTTIYTYDLSKDNLPPKKLFEGRPSRNLLIKSSQDYQQYDINLFTNFTSTYSYTYDSQGKVKRKLNVTIYKSGVGGINPVSTIAPFISTTDYTYTCQ